MKIQRTPFGRLSDGRLAWLFELRSGSLTLRLTDWGARITELSVPDRTESLESVVLGFSSLDDYLRWDQYFGCTIGRVANRIRRGAFSLDGKLHQLSINDGINTLHGGSGGIDKRLWDAEVLSEDPPSLRFFLVSEDGDQGFPGRVKIEVTFTVEDEHVLYIEYSAFSSAASPINLTNHSYFNLAGAGRGDVLSHLLRVNAKEYLPITNDLLPTGEIFPVRGNSFDLRRPMEIGHILELIPEGIDHCFVLSDDAPAAMLADPCSGRAVTITTSQPGIQVYTGNFLDGTIQGIGGSYNRHGAICLETQHFPDAVNNPAFPDTVIRPGEHYSHWVRYQFGITASA